MKRISMTIIFLILLSTAAMAAESVTGLWRGVDEKSGDSTIYAYIYEYQGKIYGRIVVTFDEGVMKDFINIPEKRAELWKGNPYYAGMDLIWGMEDRGNRWKRGKICDPKEGKIYASEIWKDGDNLIVRGKIGPFGRNQTWQPVQSRNLPPGLDYGNPSLWIPIIPELK